MPRPTPESVRMRPSIVWLALGLLLANVASAQTTAALGISIVFPVAAQTVSFASEVTLFNPGPTLLTAAVHFYEANNSVAPGTKACNDVSVPAGPSVQITLATQCALGVSGGHFGLVVVADKGVPATHAFYGYMRVQNLDNQPLAFYANGQRVMRYAPDATSPNVIGGSPANAVGAFSGQTIAGGGAAGSVVHANIRPCANQATGAFATISGGESNVAAASATVAGGGSNTAKGSFATIGGGYAQFATGSYATVGGGSQNSANSDTRR